MKVVFFVMVVFMESLNLSSLDKVIYGDDNRKDYYKFSPEFKKLADSVVSLWDETNIIFDNSRNKYILKTQKFGDRLNLCKDEPFRNQPIGAFCSGSLISQDTIITAGHCIDSMEKCKSTYFVFGYAVKNANAPDTASTEIGVDDVYRCKEIIKTHIGPEPTPSNPQGTGLGPDFAIVKLDRKVINKNPLRINKNQNLRKGDPVFVIGYPVGLPVKMADGAAVRDPSPDGYFVANLDTYGGNSGSPVFNLRTKLIEGILVRGDEDFVQTPAGCTVSNVVDNNGGRGEDVTKISALYKYLDGIINTREIMEVRSIKVEQNFDDFDKARGINFNFDK